MAQNDTLTMPDGGVYVVVERIAESGKPDMMVNTMVFTDSEAVIDYAERLGYDLPVGWESYAEGHKQSKALGLHYIMTVDYVVPNERSI